MIEPFLLHLLHLPMSESCIELNKTARSLRISIKLLSKVPARHHEQLRMQVAEFNFLSSVVLGGGSLSTNAGHCALLSGDHHQLRPPAVPAPSDGPHPVSTSNTGAHGSSNAATSSTPCTSTGSAAHPKFVPSAASTSRTSTSTASAEQQRDASSTTSTTVAIPPSVSRRTSVQSAPVASIVVDAADDISSDSANDDADDADDADDVLSLADADEEELLRSSTSDSSSKYSHHVFALLYFCNLSCR